MTALAVTATAVLPTSSMQYQRGIAGGTITAGQAIYLDTSTGKYLAASNAALASSLAVGIALNGAAINQVIEFATSGLITIGATTVQGQPYYLGTAGGIIPVDDFAGGEYVTRIGEAINVTQIDLSIKAMQVTKTGAVT